jgi:hypothetical protein
MALQPDSRLKSAPNVSMGGKYSHLKALASGNPKRIDRRVKNRLVGRALARAGFWRWLWK